MTDELNGFVGGVVRLELERVNSPKLVKVSRTCCSNPAVSQLSSRRVVTPDPSDSKIDLRGGHILRWKLCAKGIDKKLHNSWVNSALIDKGMKRFLVLSFDKLWLQLVGVMPSQHGFPSSWCGRVLGIQITWFFVCIVWILLWRIVVRVRTWTSHFHSIQG